MQCLRKFRAFRTSHYNLKWNKEKEYCTGLSCLIPVPTASQRDSGPHLSAPRAFCSTEQRRGRCPPLSRTSGEPAARHLETRVKHWIRTHKAQRILKVHLIQPLLHSQQLCRMVSKISGAMILSSRTVYCHSRQFSSLECSFNWTGIFLEAVAIHWLRETRWKSFKSLSFKHLNDFLWSAFLWNRLSLTGLYRKVPNPFYLCHK